MTRQTTQLAWLVPLLFVTLLLAQCQRPEPKSSAELEKQKATAEASPEKKPADGEPANVDVPEAEDPLGAAFPAGPTALDGLEALKYLPTETPLLVVAANPQELLDRLGRERLTKTFAQYYEMAVAEVTQAVGENVLVPRNLANVGIDPTGTAGFAMLQFNRPVGVAFWSLTDADRFKTTIYSIAGRVNERMEPHVAGNATVICPRNDEEVCFIVKDKLAFIHFADMEDEKALELALKFAAQDPEGPSLANSEGFQQTNKALAFGKDAALYIDTAAMLKSILGAGHSWAEESLAESERQLKAAQESGDESEITYLKERIKSDREWAERERKRKSAEKEMFESLLTGTGTVAMGVELAEKSLRFKSYTRLGADSRWATLARPVKGPSPIISYTRQRPFYLAHMNIDIKGYLELVDLMLAPEEMSIAKLSEQFKALTTLDLQEDLQAIFSGEIAFAIFGDLDEILTGELEGMKAIGGTLLLGLNDEEEAAKALAKILGLGMVEPFVQAVGDKSWSIPVPEWVAVSVVITNGHLIATTDPGFIAAFQSKTRRSFVDQLDNPELVSLLSLEETTGIAAMDFGSFAAVFMGLAKSAGDWDIAKAEAPSDVPLSEEYKRLEKEKNALRAKAKERRREIEAETNKRIGQIMERIGVTAMVGIKKGNDFYGYGGHYIDDESIAALVEHLIQDGIAIEELQSTRRKDVWELEDKAWELDRKMQEVRTEDLMKAAEEKYREATEQQPTEPDVGEGEADADRRAAVNEYLMKHGKVEGGNILVGGTVEDALAKKVVLDADALAAPAKAPQN